MEHHRDIFCEIHGNVATTYRDLILLRWKCDRCASDLQITKNEIHPSGGVELIELPKTKSNKSLQT